MEWGALDIRKASVLKKEVDLALLSLEQAKEDVGRRTQLLKAFQLRVDELEEFRSQYDSDERSILFEKERLRLRKAVQDATYTTSATPSAATPGPGSSTTGRKSGTSGGGGGGGMTGVVKRISFNKTPAARRPKSREGSAGIVEASALPSKTPAKIYDWEDEGKAGAAEPRMISVDGNVFAPCREPGMYVSAREELDPSAAEEFIDIQVVLSKHEVALLASRIHKQSDPQSSHFKSQISSGSVHHNTPFVDQSKLLKDLYRPDQREKWSADSDLRPNAKR